VPEDGANVPPAELSVIPRLPLSVKLAVVPSVPPLKASWLAVAEPGAAPRLASAPMFRVPPFRLVAPVKAVSYTHLDVYKRQVLLKPFRERTPLWLMVTALRPVAPPKALVEPAIRSTLL